MKICVVGAGVMGCGIAQVFAQSGYDVLLCDVNMQLVDKGVERIGKGLAKLVDKGKMARGDADAITARIAGGQTEDAGDCDLAIEAVREDMVIKRAVLKKLDEVCGEKAMLLSNTSSLSITEMGDTLSRPLTGMHFFNPAPVMKLVEVVRGLGTTDEMVAKVMDIAREIGKTPVEVTESPGFVVNRILCPMMNEAIGVFAEGVASAADIDDAMKLGANHPIGPLALSDLLGLDVLLAIMETLHAETGDPKYRPHPLLKKMVRGRLLGRKTGRGFFTYG